MLEIHESAIEAVEKANLLAQKLGLEEQLNDRLAYLANYACQEDPQATRCTLYKDFAPYSFEFVISKKKPDGTYVRWFNGGLIYHGPHDNGGDGGGPTFAVNINPENGWSIHT